MASRSSSESDSGTWIVSLASPANGSLRPISIVMRRPPIMEAASSGCSR